MEEMLRLGQTHVLLFGLGGPFGGLNMRLSNPLNIDLFEFVLFIVEHSHYVIGAVATGLAILWRAPGNCGGDKGIKRNRIALLLSAPVIAFIAIVTSIVAASWEDAYARGYKIFELPSLRQELERYIDTGEGDLQDILESDRYPPTFGVHEIRYLMGDLLRHTVFHTNDHNRDNIHEGYNKGNEWFRHFLGESMMYTSGLYPGGNETLEEAQNYKIDYVADAVELEPGMSVLDIGCGWSHMARRLTEKHGANVTGITLSREQHAHGTELNAGNGATILHQDAMTLRTRRDLPEGGFDRVTSLEMAEHVGIRRYQEFLALARDMLKDDGVFYLQVAGLRRSWRYEDLVWGLFMGEHVFPGADASCPLGWVSAQVERAGFEVQRVHNAGSHYSRTLAHWLENWRANERRVADRHGARAYRRWEVFLAWSVRAARRGSSTLWMLTLTKAGEEGRRTRSQAHLVPKDVPRMP